MIKLIDFSFIISINHTKGFESFIDSISLKKAFFNIAVSTLLSDCNFELYINIICICGLFSSINVKLSILCNSEIMNGDNEVKSNAPKIIICGLPKVRLFSEAKLVLFKL